MGDEETISPDFPPPQKATDSTSGGEISPLIIVLAGVLIGRKFILKEDKYTIGRGSDADIDTRDESVSRRHAELLKQNNRYVISDLDSRSGLYVNNCKIDRWTLKDGDIVRLGSTIFQFVQSNERKVFQFGTVKIAV